VQIPNYKNLQEAAFTSVRSSLVYLRAFQIGALESSPFIIPFDFYSLYYV